MPASLEIVVSGTPNPHAIKFTLNRMVSEQGKTYRGDPNAADAPWAKALLSIPGIVGVYGINNFISMNKQSDVAWDAIIPKAEDALRRVFP
ncbi:MAG TPA: scaffolding protein [Candidatus Omnitrophica bacterium]|nr:MAG: hypothetical protein A2Z92_05585 [Omnitrophica WOR_2 bacterium GWA2_63_20]OGX16640.1 MAG: hypothetical protein A2105_01700 [Omnitrophica WOR_2 bacterium GWF2_63_9]OGX32783.1 MAG: hypothetical protein A3E56_01240 [Omnitrophica WOR_2 bacterium RIFCSPHIGHO2_12_FULL_64_13]OGX36001.1 MAG: hypothetical protein A3B73_04510 [Omnitrophica WOR_2 bacterium RIFCSPHIGHO2_02_FULL_63_39]OGX46241.1 MAG: hypothetical protein A3I71_07475 [Omnitrophica WOR_2 bacterium RIFCSPLOWO2_02_FULL_63_16]HAM40919.1